MKIISQYYFYIITTLLIIILFINMPNSIAHSKSIKNGLYIYSNIELLSYIKALGYIDYFPNKSIVVKRNSDGSGIIFLSKFKKKAIIVQKDGVIREINLPGYPVWFNEKYKIIAWHDRENGLVYYKNGDVSEKIWNAFPPESGPDPSGNYFIKESKQTNKIPANISCNTEIYDMKNPMVPLLKLKSCGIQKIFFKNKKIFLFSKDYCLGKNTIENSITTHVFEVDNNNLIEVNKIIIDRPNTSPAPFYVLDFSPWNDDVLLVNVYDFPQRSQLYLFNLNTRKIYKIGKMPFFGGYGMFLQGDIIKKNGKIAKSTENGK